MKALEEAQARDEGLLLDLVNKLILHAQFEQVRRRWGVSGADPAFPNCEGLCGVSHLVS